MKQVNKPLVVAVFFLLFSSLGCKQQSDRPVADQEELTENSTTQAPLLLTDPASEEGLRQAAYEGNNARVKELLDQGVNAKAVDVEGRSALVFAAFNGHSDIIIELLKAGAEVNARDGMGRTALMYGSTGPFPEAVSVLLDHGADPNLVDSDEHFTALMHAAAEGHLEVVKILMDRGADPGLKDIDGDGAASFALQSGHSQVVDYLRSKE